MVDASWRNDWRKWWAEVVERLLVTYYTDLATAVGESKSLLDVGCGTNSPISKFRKRVSHTVGVDGFAASIDESERRHIHDAYRQMHILDLDKVFVENSFDCVLASDVIEHLTKEDGYRLLASMEKISGDKVIIFTPNGFLRQEEHSNNPLQRHLSGWTPDEMHALGFSCIGINGWKPLLGELGIARFRPRFFWLLVSRLTQVFVRNRPERAFQILCVKRVKRTG
jgi:ubiquinone/menaquinone biosynthesis C-methylase UbiE